MYGRDVIISISANPAPLYTYLFTAVYCVITVITIRVRYTPLSIPLRYVPKGMRSMEYYSRSRREPSRHSGSPLSRISRVIAAGRVRIKCNTYR